ncbi:MAG: methyltransferase domain-containing protein [Bacteroidales bacterium]
MFEKLNNLYLKQRFFPNIVSILINPFYFNRKALLSAIKSNAKEAKGDLLDFGCGAKPYKSLFKNTSSYVGVDIENESHNHQGEEIDFYYDGKVLPFTNESFDIVFSSEVLEHVPNLYKSLSEIERVVKENGLVLMTIPFTFAEHEMPYDYRRFTKNGIVEILDEFGFETIKKSTYGTYIEVISQLIILYVHDLIYTKNKYFNIILNSIFIFPLTLFGMILSTVLPNNKSLYFGTVILAKKKRK